MDVASGRAVVIAVIGPVRAGKGLTTGLQGLAGLLHGDRVKRIVDDNPALLTQDFEATRRVIGRMRGPTNLARLWPTLSPAARLNLCLDPWGECPGLNLSSIGLKRWHRHWGNQGFQILCQDSYLEPAGQLPYTQLVRDLQDCRKRVNTDPGLPRVILLEGFEWIMPQYRPNELLPLIDYMVVLHAPEKLIKSRANRPDKWEREVLPMVKEFGHLFPQQSPPHRDVIEEGIWRSVPSVDHLGLSGLNLQMAHFMGPGTKGEDMTSRARQLGELILAHVAAQVSRQYREEEKSSPMYDRASWRVFPAMNCYDGHGGANVNLKDDNARPKTMSVEDAEQVCEERGYAGFTYEPGRKRVWWLSSVDDPEKFVASKRFQVHALSAARGQGSSVTPRSSFLPSGSWQRYPGMNCFDGHGGANVDLADDDSHPKIMSIEDAERVCEKSGYAGFTYEPSRSRVWWLSSAHDPGKFNPRWGEQFEVHVRVPPDFSGL